MMTEGIIKARETDEKRRPSLLRSGENFHQIGIKNSNTIKLVQHCPFFPDKTAFPRTLLFQKPHL